MKRLPRWTAKELDLLRTRYTALGPDGVAAVLGRSRYSVMNKAQRSGIVFSRSWSEQETEYLRQNYETLGVGVIARALKRHRGSVSGKARRIGIRKSFAWNEQETGFLKLHYPERGPSWVAKQLGRARASVAGRARRLGVRYGDEDQRSDKLNILQVRAIRAKRASGEHPADLAAEFGVTRACILYHSKDIPTPPRRKPRNQKVDPSVALDLLGLGLTKQAICERFGCTKPALYRTMQRYCALHGISYPYTWTRKRAA